MEDRLSTPTHPVGQSAERMVDKSAPGGLKPHRGGVILALGIIGLVLCFICGIIAWVMGNDDLRQMDAGVMDPSGRGLTKAGKICGMISVILAIVGIGIWLLMLIIAGAGTALSQ